MMQKSWCNIEEVPYYFSRSSIKFQGHMGQKSLILTRIEHFRTGTPVWFHQWIWNDAQNLRYYCRCALLFCEVIHQISRPHRLKNWRLESNLGKIIRPVTAIKSLRFALLVQVMVCCLFGAKPLPEPRLAYCQLDSLEQISVKFESFHSRKCSWKCDLPKWWPFCPGGYDS